jgi:hypothetical protein
MNATDTKIVQLLEVLREIAISASRQQASGGDLLDFQDRLRECGDKARAAITAATNPTPAKE